MGQSLTRGNVPMSSSCAATGYFTGKRNLVIQVICKYLPLFGVLKLDLNNYTSKESRKLALKRYYMSVLRVFLGNQTSHLCNRKCFFIVFKIDINSVSRDHCNCFDMTFMDEHPHVPKRGRSSSYMSSSTNIFYQNSEKSKPFWKVIESFFNCFDMKHEFTGWTYTCLHDLRGYCTSGPYFWRLCAFSQKIKQLWTKYPMDMVRNVPRNSKITVLLQ